MNIDLGGKRAIVAGGSRGIGRAIALAFAEAGAGVSICARGAERLAATREEIARHGGTTHCAVCDLADEAAVPRYVEEAAGALGGIDILVNNASGFGTTADKAAVLEYTLTQAATLARKGIRVNCIAPGSIEFPGGTWERARLNNPDLYGRILRSIPFGRLGRPEEVARVALFLCSPLAGWVTGQNIAVDGGQML